MRRSSGLLATCLVALLLLGQALPVAAHPAVVTPASVESGDQPEARPGPAPANDDPDRSREFFPVVTAEAISGTVDAPSAPPAPFWLAAALALRALAVVATIGRRRRAVAVLLTTVVAVLAFEAGLHSVHHLGDRQELASCTIASASGHLVGTETGALAFDPPTSPTFERPHRISWMAPIPRALDPHESRGPPASFRA